VEELTDSQIEELKADLLALREQLRLHLSDSSEGQKPVDLDEPIGRVSRIDAIQQQKMAQANRRNAELRQQRVTVALAAIEDGTFGECRRCEECIGFRRLKARPESTLCLECQSAREAR
jgi:DnaK suppressor protein